MNNINIIEFVAIQLSTLRPGYCFNFDLYILVDSKYLLYIQKGDSIEQDRLDRLMKSKADRMYIRDIDLSSYEKYIETEINRAVNDLSISIEDSAQIVEDAAINALDALNSMIDNPNSEIAYKMTLNATNGLIGIVTKRPNALKVIFDKEGKTHSKILNHCKNVCALVCRFAFLNGITGQKLSDLGTAALLHDIGLSKMKKDDQVWLFIKKEELMTPDDARIYKLHVKDGVDLLNSKEYVNSKIISYIEKHHENLCGTGYPNKLKKLEKGEEILSLCNLFDKKLIQSESDPEKIYNEILEDFIGIYNLETIKKFKEVLKSEGLME